MPYELKNCLNDARDENGTIGLTHKNIKRKMVLIRVASKKPFVKTRFLRLLKENRKAQKQPKIHKKKQENVFFFTIVNKNGAGGTNDFNLNKNQRKRLGKTLMPIHQDMENAKKRLALEDHRYTPKNVNGSQGESSTTNNLILMLKSNDPKLTKKPKNYQI